MFADEHQIFVPEMRRDNLNDLHEAATDEVNCEDHEGWRRAYVGEFRQLYRLRWMLLGMSGGGRH